MPTYDVTVISRYLQVSDHKVTAIDEADARQQGFQLADGDLKGVAVDVIERNAVVKLITDAPPFIEHGSETVFFTVNGTTIRLTPAQARAFAQDLEYYAEVVSNGMSL